MEVASTSAPAAAVLLVAWAACLVVAEAGDHPVVSLSKDREILVVVGYPKRILEYTKTTFDSCVYPFGTTHFWQISHIWRWYRSRASGRFVQRSLGVASPVFGAVAFVALPGVFRLRLDGFLKHFWRVL